MWNEKRLLEIQNNMVVQNTEWYKLLTKVLIWITRTVQLLLNSCSGNFNPEIVEK